MCKRLSLWWSAGDSDQIFWRNSGFLARGPKGCVEHQYGDVHSIDERGSYLVQVINIELKFYKQLTVIDVIDKPGKAHVTLLDHWAQCKQDAEKSEREPMLIAKRNFAEPFVMCYEDLARELVEDGDRLTFYDGDNYVSLFALDRLEEFVRTAAAFADAFKRVKQRRGVA